MNQNLQGSRAAVQPALEHQHQGPMLFFATVLASAIELEQIPMDKLEALEKEFVMEGEGRSESRGHFGSSSVLVHLGLHDLRSYIMDQPFIKEWFRDIFDGSTGAYPMRSLVDYETLNNDKERSAVEAFFKFSNSELEIPTPAKDAITTLRSVTRGFIWSASWLSGFDLHKEIWARLAERLPPSRGNLRFSGDRLANALADDPRKTPGRHPEESQLSSYGRAALKGSPEDLKKRYIRVDRHVSKCPGCAAIAATYLLDESNSGPHYSEIDLEMIGRELFEYKFDDLSENNKRAYRHVLACPSCEETVSYFQMGLVGENSRPQEPAIAEVPWPSLKWGMGNLPGANIEEIKQLLDRLNIYGERWLEIPIEALGSTLEAEYARSQGDWAKESRSLTRALDICRQVRLWKGEGDTLISLGLLSRLEGDYQEAESHLTEALAILEPYFDSDMWAVNATAIAQHSLGELYRIRGNWQQSTDFLDEAERSLRKDPDADHLGLFLVFFTRGAVEYDKRVYSEAKYWLEKAWEVSQTHRSPDWSTEELMVDMYQEAVDCQLNLAKSLDGHDESVAKYRGVANKEWSLRALLLRIGVYVDHEIFDRAGVLAEEAVLQAEPLGLDGIAADAVAYKLIISEKQSHQRPSAGKENTALEFYRDQAVVTLLAEEVKRLWSTIKVDLP